MTNKAVPGEGIFDLMQPEILTEDDSVNFVSIIKRGCELWKEALDAAGAEVSMATHLHHAMIPD